MTLATTRKGNSRREKIISAARELYSTQGVSFVTLTELARASGLRASLVLYYFPDIRQVFREVVIRVMDEGLVLAQGAIQATGNARTDLANYVHAMFLWTSVFPGNRGIILQFYAECLFHPQLLDLNVGVIREGKERIEAIVQAGIDEGSFRARNAESAAFAIQSLITGAVFRLAVDPTCDLHQIRASTREAAERIALG